MPFIEAVVEPPLELTLTAAPAPTLPDFATPVAISRPFVSCVASTFKEFPTVIVALPTEASTLVSLEFTVTTPAAAAEKLSAAV